jgi:hypothetical protein
MTPYTGTWWLMADPGVSPAAVAYARKLVGTMQDTGVPQAFRRLDDGSTVHVLLVNGIPKVTITAPTTKAPPPRLDTTDLWVPRGLVVYPAWTAAPGGVGLPIVQYTTFGPYDPENLAPGLNPNRWTAGGPCGEVLLSPDENAGYPRDWRDVAVPLLYHPTKGPVFEWTGEGMFDARKPDGAWQAYRMELVPFVANYPDESAEQAAALFEAINVHRAGAGQTVLNLLPRGHYRPAKIMASIMLTAGSTAETSASYPDTYTTSADRLTKDGYSAELAYGTFTGWARGDNPTAYELRASGGTPASLVAGWAADGPSNSVLTLDVGRAAFGDVGYRGGYWCADVISRTRWIEAGNCSWQGSDAELPPLSWHGFASVNLEWETYPATYDVDHYTTAPLVPLYAFTSAAGDCWLSYPRAAAPALADTEPAMGRHIYCRGRSIAVAPRGGLVWGACLQTFGGGDRLIALVHHPEDQPTDYTSEGWTRYLRVWWCDIPRREHLRADPQRTICGEDASDAWGWKGGELIDVGHMSPPPGGSVPAGAASSLKVASQWRFNGSGTRAICLRDYGLLADYSVLYATVGIQTQTGTWPRAVELQFDLTAETTTTTLTFHGYTAGAFAPTKMIAGPLDIHDDPGTPVYQHGAVPVAVDYDGQGNVVYAFTAEIASFNHTGDISYSYIGTGPAAATYASDLGNRVLHGAALKTVGSNFRPSGVLVADVISGTFVGEGVRPRIDAATGDDTGAACYPFTANPVHGVRMWRGGALLDESWYAAPDGAVFSLASVCDNSIGSSVVFVELPLAASRNVQCYLADRLGARVFSTQVAPLPLALRFLDAAPADATCGCRVEIHAVANNSHAMSYAELNPRGGRAVSSVPLPDADWLIYAKVV